MLLRKTIAIKGMMVAQAKVAKSRREIGVLLIHLGIFLASSLALGSVALSLPLAGSLAGPHAVIDVKRCQ
ncbi:hypothetical protein KTAU_21630 [Thermogemmatispora aurantia]|uniref:Uncharacterized protein n=1 Tax=Thermogemmatispora aurantia TaxID=2045279 RepID=A0A5J4KBM4_9CHLR|nr:hypothetical protein KTAU_21630 [Thermogemmatispora aurantia]